MQIIALILLTCSAPHSASAQSPQQNALARTLFEEGVALADRSDWQAAADRFSRAYSLKPTAGIAFNWASVLIESGALVHAHELLLSVMRDVAADTQIKANSQALLTTLTPRIAKLRVHVAGAADAQTTLEVDGLGWPRAAWDMASPIDPGAHAVVLKNGATEAARTDLTLAEGELREISLQVEAKEERASVGLAQATAATEDSAKPPLYKNWIVWTGVGAVVAAGVITAVVLSTHKGSKDESPVTGNASPGVIHW